jgi:hypothetical protein
MGSGFMSATSRAGAEQKEAFLRLKCRKYKAGIAGLPLLTKPTPLGKPAR